MDSDCRKVLRDNLDRLMQARQTSRRQLVRDGLSYVSGRKKGKPVSSRAIGYLLEVDGPSPQLDLVEAVALALGKTPWEILTQDFDPARNDAELLSLARAIKSQTGGESLTATKVATKGVASKVSEYDNGNDGPHKKSLLDELLETPDGRNFVVKLVDAVGDPSTKAAVAKIFDLGSQLAKGPQRGPVLPEPDVQHGQIGQAKKSGKNSRKARTDVKHK